MLGSKDEAAGNQSCQAVVASDGGLRLQLWLPDGWGSASQYLVLTGMRFAHGQEAILQALTASWIVTGTTSLGNSSGSGRDPR
ncbi:hypothetical protein [Candidatus Methylacidithermus pantelleriae]|uniref:Uncharacterized protein n=1 Tax=Candidatus Methylacidithermus pantelleriae TaxID=2744239 RepID=A0A8J2BL72_9BACT|nr:hypothetical protein [Candidatus Methylacidithermus pantelleriae]CAF0702254.1 hypothetical protein MPNT_50013 [Candidatus Methylacidithermus pantelleriae]